jgi:hypothetical protein
MTALGVLLLSGRVLSAVPMTATETGTAAIPPGTGSGTASDDSSTPSLCAPAASATIPAAPEWTQADLGWLRCKHALHVRERDEGWTFAAWLDPRRCPPGDRSAKAVAAWDRYTVRSRRFDECVSDRRTRKPVAFVTGFVGGGLATAALMGITRAGSYSGRVAAASGAGVVIGGLWWWRESRRPDRPCGSEPGVEWPR